MNLLDKEADRIEKEIIDSFEDDANPVIDAIIAYLQDIKKGNNSDDAELYLYPLIDHALSAPFCDTYKPQVAFITNAIRWQAEQIASEEEKLTRPTP